MKPKISLIGLGVRDFARSLRFSRDGLGFPPHNFVDGEDHVMFRLEGTWPSPLLPLRAPPCRGSRLAALEAEIIRGQRAGRPPSYLVAP
jgi:catechol 2,3-dioxygenase-like lactoylglutathione lyase family enzyme